MLTKEDIDRIVHEVMQRLAMLEGDPRAVPSQADHASLRMNDAVISLASLEGRLDHVRQLIVNFGAVITPSVRDILRQCQIELVWVESTTTQANKTAQLVVANLTSWDISPLVDSLDRETRFLKCDSLPASIENMIHELTVLEHLGLIVTNTPEEAVCLANRNSGIRAVQGVHQANVKRAVSTIAANLLIMEPDPTHVFKTQELLRSFVCLPRHSASVL